MKKIEKEDFRRVDDSIKQAIRLIKQGEKKGEIAVVFGVNKNTISNWSKSYQERGETWHVTKYENKIKVVVENLIRNM